MIIRAKCNWYTDEKELNANYPFLHVVEVLIMNRHIIYFHFKLINNHIPKQLPIQKKNFWIVSSQCSPLYLRYTRGRLIIFGTFYFYLKNHQYHKNIYFERLITWRNILPLLLKILISRLLNNFMTFKINIRKLSHIYIMVKRKNNGLEHLVHLITQI